MDERTKKRKYHSYSAYLTWETAHFPIDTNGRAEIEIPKLVSILMDSTTEMGSYCKKVVGYSINDVQLKRELKEKLEYVRNKCHDKSYSSIDDDVNKIIVAYKGAMTPLQTTS